MNSTSNTAIETIIVRKIVSAALNSNWRISVFDGEEFRVKESIDACAIMNAVMSTDCDVLTFWDGELWVGEVTLVYGNGYDVIADCTEGLVEDMLKPIMDWVDARY